MGVHEDTLQGLTEALEYVKGDKSKGRSEIVKITDEETEIDIILFQKIRKLSSRIKKKQCNM